MGDREDRERYSTYLRNMRIREDKPFDRITSEGVREIGFKHLLQAEHVIWKIYPDGSAKYVSKYSPNWAINYRDFIDTIPDDPRVRTEQAM